MSIRSTASAAPRSTVAAPGVELERDVPTSAPDEVDRRLPGVQVEVEIDAERPAAR